MICLLIMNNESMNSYCGFLRVNTHATFQVIHYRIFFFSLQDYPNSGKGWWGGRVNSPSPNVCVCVCVCVCGWVGGWVWVWVWVCVHVCVYVLGRNQKFCWGKFFDWVVINREGVIVTISNLFQS